MSLADDLTAAWGVWSQMPGDRHTAHTLEDVVQTAGARIDQPSTAIRVAVTGRLRLGATVAAAVAHTLNNL